MTNSVDLTLIQRLMAARASGMQKAMEVEHEIAQKMVRADVLERDPHCLRTAHPDAIEDTPFRSAEKLSHALDSHLPKKMRGKYDPKFASDRTATLLWQLRQTIDQLGMPFEAYVDAAMAYVGKPNGRAPRLSQLMSRDVIVHVAGEWAAKQ